jgi:glycosyltransferase involved in cell wall biosynthesis
VAMISVLTITYKRAHLLEEAIQSFLEQDIISGAEMVIINDNPEVDYVYDHPRVKIINHKERFPSISSKLEFGYRQCKNEFIYRLDDDDLLAPDALKIVLDAIYSKTDNTAYHEIYRSRNHYFFENNKFVKLADNINNGNVYSKAYLNRITFPDKSGDEDADITFNHNASIYTIQKPTMLYRWGMNTLHISGMGKQTNEAILKEADKVLKEEKGVVVLKPHFKNDYYSQIK